MTTEETRTINDKLDAILARVGGLESRMNGIETEFVGVKNEFSGIKNEFATLKGELRANIWQTSFQIIAVYAGAIGITFVLIRLYGA
jgi:hypothetical protein